MKRLVLLGLALPVIALAAVTLPTNRSAAPGRTYTPGSSTLGTVEVNQILDAIRAIDTRLTVLESPPAPPTFYVATTGSDAADGSSLTPWRTIQKAMNSATPGSTVNIRAGTYPERLTVNVSGTAEKPIIFQPEGFVGTLDAAGKPSCGGYTGVACAGAAVTLDYTSLGTVTDGVPFLKVDGKSYVTVRGLTFQNLSNSGGMQRGVQITGSSYVTVSHSKFLHNKGVGTYGPSEAFLHFFVEGASHHVLVAGNEFGDLVTQYSEALSTIESANITIAYNWLYDLDAIGIDVGQNSTYNVVRGNLLERVSRKADGTAFHATLGASNAIYLTGCQHPLVERNIVRFSGWGIGASSEITYPAVVDVTVRNNLLHDNGITAGPKAGDGGGLFVGCWASYCREGAGYDGTPHPELSDGWVVTGNTIYRNQGQGGVIQGIARNVVLKNNIIAGNTNAGVITAWNTDVAGSVITSGYTYSYSLLNANGSSTWGSAAHTNEVALAPGFVSTDATNPDLHLAAGSAALNAGHPTYTAQNWNGIAETDADGQSRVYGTAVDLGALERQQ